MSFQELRVPALALAVVILVIAIPVMLMSDFDSLYRAFGLVAVVTVVAFLLVHLELRDRDG